jgi:hypothetical protein
MKENLFFQQYSYDSAAARALGAEFGFESELLSSELALDKYLPLFVGAQELQQKSSHQRSEVLAKCLKSLKFGEKKEVLHSKEFLPSLHRDDSGNLEWTLGPKEKFSELREEATLINKEVGESSYQAMVSFLFEKFFLNSNSAAQSLGWLNFFHELDILERAVIGKNRWDRFGVSSIKNIFASVSWPHDCS